MDVLQKFNGLHNFMNWKKPILTDSGGYLIIHYLNLTKLILNWEQFLNLI